MFSYQDDTGATTKESFEMDLAANGQHRKSLVMGNWKSNGSMKHIDEFANHIVKDIEFDSQNMDVIVAPPMIYAPVLKEKLGEEEKIAIGAQDIS